MKYSQFFNTISVFLFAYGNHFVIIIWCPIVFFDFGISDFPKTNDMSFLFLLTSVCQHLWFSNNISSIFVLISIFQPFRFSRAMPPNILLSSRSYSFLFSNVITPIFLLISICQNFRFSNDMSHCSFWLRYANIYDFLIRRHLC